MIDTYDFRHFSSDALGAFSISTGLNDITSAYKDAVQESAQQDPEGFQQALVESARTSAINEAKKVAADVDAAKKLQDDARGIFVSRKKKTQAMLAMGVALSAMTALIKKYQSTPYYKDVYPIISTYLSQKSRLEAESKLLDQEIKEMQEDSDKPLMASLGIKNPEYIAYGFGGLLLLGMLNKLRKRKAERKKSSPPPRRKQPIESVYK